MLDVSSFGLLFESSQLRMSDQRLLAQLSIFVFGSGVRIQELKWLCSIVLSCIILYGATFCHIAIYCIVFCSITLLCIALCYVILCDVMLCYVMLYYVICLLCDI